MACSAQHVDTHNLLVESLRVVLIVLRADDYTKRPSSPNFYVRLCRHGSATGTG